MRMIGVAELKSKLSEYLAQVKAGEEIVVTEHGRPVAKLVKASPDADDGLDDLVRRGIVKRGSGEPIPDSFFDAPRPKSKGASVTEALIEERRSGR
ncbi:MAG: type II toxin-antitoxin system Phd/YefM family antitoxin [Solirubrobacterales bacterium]